MNMNLFWKIQLCKFTEIFDSGFVINTCRLFRVFEHAQINLFSIYNDLRAVSLVLIAPSNTFITGMVILLLAAVLGVLNMRAIPKIFILIIQAIVVFMVNLHTWRRRHDFIVHEYYLSFSQTARCVAIGIAFFMIHPVILREIIKAMIGNKCNLSVSERNFFCHIFSNKIHPSIVQLSRLPHGAVNNQRVQLDYKTKSVQSNLDKFNYTTALEY